MEWTKRWNQWIAPNPSRPGIYRMRAGGYLVRIKVTNPKTGKLATASRVLPDATIEQAQTTLDALRVDKKQEVSGRKPQRQLFSVFAVSRLEAKVDAGDIESAKGIQKWKSILRVHLIPAFGELHCDEIRAWDVEQWRMKLAGMIARGYVTSRPLRNGKVQERHINLQPGTANTWIGIARTIFAEMTTILELPRNPAAGLNIFDTKRRPTYTKKNPNTLTSEQAREFLTLVREDYVQHYAMTLLGFVTGKRPSTLRPLRGSGEGADVNWETGEIDWRRSHTVGDKFMDGTKTAASESTHVPASVLEALRAHVELVKDPPRFKRGGRPLWWRKSMASSELLFPGRDGGPRSPSCLDEMFADVSKRIGLEFRLTPRAMRRTFNDLAREAKIADVVTRSISGHLTEEMQLHYSHAQAEEQRQAIGKVIDLVAVRAARAV